MITPIQASQVPKELLLLADPDWSKVQQALEQATIYGYQLDGQIVGVLVLQSKTVAIKEITIVAVIPSYQHRGIARALLQLVIKSCQQETACEQLQIGTGNSSLHQLALYQHAGFEMVSVWVDYFVDNYPEPIYENGLQCKSMVRLALNVKAG